MNEEHSREVGGPPDFQARSDVDPWEEIGFHRPLGGMFFNLVIMVFSAVLGILTIAFLTSLLYPYPEIQGYGKVAGGFFFSLVYQIFDFGTAYGIQRFIAEYRVKDPEKMLEYVQFFVWYQMFTGIVQVLVISVVVLRVVVHTQFAYLAWVFLVICQKQWPGMLGTFKAVLDGMQLYNKTNVLAFVGSDVFQNISNVAFILLGRYIGQRNPAVGDLMGAVLGAAVGAYVDDFFAMALSMWYMSKVTRPFGFSARDCWRFGFSWGVAKRCMWFGFQVSIVPVINSATSTYMLFLYLGGLPQYTTFVAIRDVAAGVAGVVNMSTPGSTPLIAESYMNDKKELASFYITSSIRWNGFLMWMLVAVVVAFIPMIFEVLLELPELANYARAQAFLIPLLIHTIFRPYIDFPNGILIGTERVTFYTAVRLFEEALQVFFVWAFLFWWRLPEVWGFSGIVFVLSFEHFFPRLIKMALCWMYIKTRLFPIKINWWQTLLGPIACSFFVFWFGYAWNILVFVPLLPVAGVLVTAALTVVVGIVLIPFVFYLPLTGLLGLWDDFSMETFRKAVELSGPSKPLVKLFYRSTLWGVRHSPLHNRFKTPWEAATRELAELSELKRHNEAVLYKKRVSSAAWLREGEA
ncbi:MAG: hypothetical protein ACTSU5_02115 [Promethearchaeota archaeon]